MNESNAIAELAERQEFWRVIKNNVKVIGSNSIDAYTTFFYLTLNHNAVELSPFAFMGIEYFLMVKLAIIPPIYWWFTFGDKDRQDKFANLIMIVYLCASAINVYNIYNFIY